MEVGTCKPLINSSAILEEIKNVLISNPNMDSNCISLYDVAYLLKRKKCGYERNKNSFDDYFHYVIKSRFGSSSSIVVYDFDYDKNEMRIGIRNNDLYGDYDEIVFAKKGEDLYVKRAETNKWKAILFTLGDDLSELYDKLIQYKNFKKQNKYYLKSVNSNFLVNVSFHGVNMFLENPLSFFIHDFQLDSLSYKSGYNCECNSNAVISTIRGKENEIFKKIVIRIDDCPEWMQTQLYEIRQNQLLEAQRKLKVERKKQKRLELKRKIFPFKKNKRGLALLCIMFILLITYSI